MILGFGLELGREVVDLLETRDRRASASAPADPAPARSPLPPPTFSSASCSSCLLAFSTSPAGPLMVTRSEPEPSEGK